MPYKPDFRRAFESLARIDGHRADIRAQQERIRVLDAEIEAVKARIGSVDADIAAIRAQQAKLTAA